MLIKRKGRERNKSEEMEAEEGSGLSDRKAGPKWHEGTCEVVASGDKLKREGRGGGASQPSLLSDHANEILKISILRATVHKALV